MNDQPVPVFHVELRQFPRSAHAFNLSESELRSGVLEPWLRGRAFELAEQRWRPDEARLTVLEGRHLEAHELSMGRGWAAAVRHGRDVTVYWLAEGGSAQTGGAAADGAPAADALAGYRAELLDRCARAPVSPREALRLASRWLPAAGAAARLSLAERVVRELVLEGVAVLGRGTDAAGAAEHPVPPGELGGLLAAWETWAEEPPGVFLCATSTGARVARAVRGDES